MRSRGSARSSAVDSTSKVERRRARRPPARVPNLSGASPPFERGCASATGEWKGVPTGQARAVGEQHHNEPKPVVPPQGQGQATTEISDRRGAFLATTEPAVGLRPRPGGGHASRDRTHRRARDWQRYVVGKVLQSPRIPRDPDAGAGLVTATAVGARAGEPAARSTIERGGRLKLSGTHPLASVAQGHDALGLRRGQCHMCTLLRTRNKANNASLGQPPA
jgi:hypothetical protein